MSESAHVLKHVYRKLYTRLWRHPSFQRMTEGERLLAMYLVSGPQTNQIGCYYFSPALACEDLRVSPPQLRKRMSSVFDAFGWEWYEVDRLVYIPSWFEWNRPNGSKVMEGWRQMVDDIPIERLRNAVRSALDRRQNGNDTQEQEQEREQDQDVPPNPPAGGRRLTAKELQKAREHIARIGGCGHGLTHDIGECARMLALSWRGEQVSA